MPSFHDVRLPENIERGAMGGPEFKTTIMATPGGLEKRNIDWSRTRASWDVGYGIQMKEDFEVIINFFYARMGRAYGFRFKDWTDFEIASEQSIGTGDGVEKSYQIYKQYISGGYFYNRDIKKPIAGTVQVYLDSVLQGGGFSIDYGTGIITFNTAPASNVNVGVICEFDVPVRFDMDKFDLNAEMWNVASIPNISLVELKDG